MKVMLGWIFFRSPLLILDIFIVYLFCFTLIFIFIGFIWYKPPQDISILMSWLNSINYIIMYAKILMIRQSSIFLLDIPIKVHQSVLSNCNCLWSMINIFSRSSSFRARLTHFCKKHGFWYLALVLDMHVFPLFNIQFQLSGYCFILILKQRLNTPLV